MSTPKRFLSSTLSDLECTRRVGLAYSMEFPWNKVVSADLTAWIAAVGASRKCRPEYLLLSMLPTISALSGPKTTVDLEKDFHVERLNLYLCLLGATGANKSQAYQLAHGVVKQVAEEDYSIILDSNWTRSGLLGHLAASNGRCLLAYEEMDSFFMNIVKAEKLSIAERTFFCELYDGSATTVTRASNDGKPVKMKIENISMNISGFHQPEAFLKDYYDLALRKDGFMERFLVACPLALRLSQEDVTKGRHDLRDGYDRNMWDFMYLYDVISHIHRPGQTYELSVDAKKEYDCLAGEENEVFNALIEKKMDYAKGELNEEDSLSTTLESKYTRSVVKLAACLHILAASFERIINPADNDHYLFSPLNPTISLATFHQAMRLAEYFGQQREILFEKCGESQAPVQTDAERSTEQEQSGVKRKILLSKGKVAVRRLIGKSYEASKRPSSDNIMKNMQELEQEGVGKVVKRGQVEGYVKPPTLSPDQYINYQITEEQYKERYESEEKNLSKNQKSIFDSIINEQVLE